MADQPASPKLWHAIVIQARAKFQVYPSPAAAHWVHEQYVKHGGQFVGGKKKNRR